MINYLNIYDQLQTLSELKSNMLHSYNITIIFGISIAIFLTIVGGLSIYISMIECSNNKNTYKLNKITIIVLVIYISLIIPNTIIIKQAKDHKQKLYDTNINIIQMYVNDEPKYLSMSSKYMDTINNLLTDHQLQDMLTVNGVTNIDTFKSNIEYLKDTYTMKVKTFKVMYGKNATISEDEYINSILNQFYLGKIDNTPTDITGFEEDYPRISINLKK